MEQGGGEEKESERVVKKTERELIDFVKKNRGRVAFLIGAGTSSAAGIPTAWTLMEQWRREKYESVGGDSEQEEDFETWVAETEEQMKEDDNRYGFWFEQCHHTVGDRRAFIQDLVEGKEPTFGLVALAQIMAKGDCPVTLTPNFDDLLYDAFYLFLENRPLLINHDALAPQYRVTEDRPTIIKLHGDYLYDNLKNTKKETAQLEKNMDVLLNYCLKEYGLLVIGYGGNDSSIMDVLANHTPQYGIWWCSRDGVDSLSSQTKTLLENSNTFFVKISGSEDFLTRLGFEFQFPLSIPKEIVERANKRKNMLEKMIQAGTEDAESTVEVKEDLDILLLAMNYLEKADELILKEEYEAALKELDKVEEIGKVEYTYINRGICYWKLEEYEKALENLDIAIDLDPENAYAYLFRGNINLQKKELEEALDDYHMAIELDPDDSDIYFNRGLCYGSMEEYEKALADFNSAIELNSNDSDYFKFRGHILLSMKMYEDALQDFTKALELNPDDPTLYSDRGITYQEMEEYEKALDDFNYAIESNPDNPNLYFYRANTFSEMKEYDKSLSDYSKSIQLNPDDSDFYFNRALIFAEMENFTRALEDTNTAIEMNPEDPDAYYNRAFLFFEMKKFEEALEDFNLAIDLNPYDPIFYSTRADLYYDIEEYEKAVKDYDKAIELDPTSSVLYCNRGVTFIKIKQYDKAKDDYDSAIRINPEDSLSFVNYVEFCIITGDYSKAESLLDELLSMEEDIEEKVISVLFSLILKRILNKETEDIEKEYTSLLSEASSITWDFAELDSWLKQTEMKEEDRIYIEKFIDMMKIQLD